ncbi:Rid family detoxifying hydrolase [Devosia sp. ZB163]|uniref:Rid family detoxifying hydrolase n=1 Tax=Devosia sp. ZB163 TaxID=3025938 RepID=UPI0023604F08|nr:Rid family detoxifying hydrolase [Devosia sp. ZB163]MDC9825310.1 Rid family detoxifying hydrolase [Devosia sp. ZB163]
MGEIKTDRAPAAIGPYAQARTHGGLLFISGQLPIDPATGQIPADPVEQMHQVLRNLSAVAEAAGTDIRKAIKTTVFVTDLSIFKDLNSAYATAFVAPFPARATVQVAALPMGAKVEVEAVVEL